MKFFIIVVVVLGLGYLVKNRMNGSVIHSVDIASLSLVNDVAPEMQAKPIESCLKFSSCVFVYVAPWCPYCHSFLENFALVRNKLQSQSIGLVVVVGADKERSKELAMRAQYSDNAVVDSPDHQFQKNNKVEHYPYFIVAGANREVKFTGQRATDFINENMNARENQLKK